MLTGFDGVWYALVMKNTTKQLINAGWTIEELVTRSRVKLTQEFLLMLTDMQQLPRDLRIAENCPITLNQLAIAIYPEWEPLVNVQIAEHATMVGVGVPDFTECAKLDLGV